MKTTAIYYDNFFSVGPSELIEECRYYKEEKLTGYRFKNHLWYSFVSELESMTDGNLYIGLIENNHSLNGKCVVCTPDHRITSGMWTNNERVKELPIEEIEAWTSIQLSMECIRNIIIDKPSSDSDDILNFKLMSLVSCHNQSNRETHPSSAEEKVNDYIFDDGHKYDGWGCYRNGNFIPHGCGKAQYPEYYAYGNFKDGTLNGPAIISYDHYMYTMHFKNDRGNGWGLHINDGHLVEFGYYNDSQLQTNLTAFVRWYYEGVLVKSERNGEKLMSMYTSKETKEVVNLLIGYAPKKESDSIALVCMGFRFKADGSVWVGNGNLNNMTGNYIHFRPDGCVDIGVFINGVLSKRMPLQMFIDDYFGTHKISKDSKIASLLMKCFPETSTQHKRESERKKYRNIVEPKVDYSYFIENFNEEAINYASVETGHDELF